MKKLPKPRNSPSIIPITRLTRKETPQTPITPLNLTQKETPQTPITPIKKETPQNFRTYLGSIGNNILFHRILFFLGELGELVEVQCRGRSEGRENIQYISSRGETPQTPKLPSPYRGDHRGIALLAMSLHPGLSLRPPSPAERPHLSHPSPHLGRCTRDNVPSGVPA